MAHHLPDTMTAVVAEARGGPLTCARVEVPRPGPGEVLVRMAAAPVHPSDLGVIDGRYSESRDFPLVPGAEGSGTVVAAGGGTLARLLVGRRVACAASPPHPGTWAEYLCTAADRCVPLARGVDLERGAMLLVNPVTALAVLEIARRGKHAAIVNVAAGGALGRMITRLAARKGIPVIAVVRRAEGLAVCRSDGAREALAIDGAGFDESLRRLAHELDATLLLDCVAGAFTQRLLAASPEASTVLVYGALDAIATTLDPRLLLYGNRRVEGFFLPLWAREKGVFERLVLTRRAQRLLADELATQVRERVPLDGAGGAVERYRQAMTGGKVVLEIDRDALPAATIA